MSVKYFCDKCNKEVISKKHDVFSIESNTTKDTIKGRKSSLLCDECIPGFIEKISEYFPELNFEKE